MTPEVTAPVSAPSPGAGGIIRAMARPSCDVAVVGGGLVGAALAFELVTAGVDVLLVDHRHRGRATDAGAGILSPDTATHPDPRWSAMAKEAGEHYPALVARLAETGAGDTGYARCGLLSVGLDEREHAWFAAAVDATESRAPGSLRRVTADDARALFPALARVHEAAFCAGAARVDGRSMAAALLQASDRAGLRRLDAEAVGFEVTGGRVVGVRTSEGTVPCGAAAIAGGAWTPSLGASLGLALPVVPTKGQIVHLRLEGADTGRWPIVQPVAHHYLVSWPGGRVACGGTFEQAGFDSRPTAAGLRELLRECLRVAPGLADAGFAEVRVGLRPVTPDDLPVLGPVPGWPTVHLATGHGANGLLLGPHNAAAVARGVLGQPPGQWLSMCAAERFPRGGRPGPG